MNNIIISNKENLEKTKEAILKSGKDKIHIISDFDKTLTTSLVKGTYPSVTSVLRDQNYLSPDYAIKAKELYSKYHPIENDPNIPFEQKKKAMEEWWRTHFALLIQYGLNKNDIRKSVELSKVKFKEGFAEFMELLKKDNIPLVIVSSSGIGTYCISLYFEREKKLYQNVHIISNSYEWDENGKAVAVNEPIIHNMNKDGYVIRNVTVFETIKDRKNVILLGDTIDDVLMVKGFEYDNLIKIGFLNENVEENLEKYKENFDVVLLNDSSLNYVNELLKELMK